LEVFFSHLHRCSALALCVSDEDIGVWNAALSGQQKLHALRTLRASIHSYGPQAMQGPPASLTHFMIMCSGLRSLRLSTCPTLHLHEKFTPLQLTTLDVRCTGDAAFLHYVCRHTQALHTLVLRDYSACVFAAPALTPTCCPSVTSLALEFRDAALAEGLINLTLFLNLPNLTRLAIMGSGTPGVGHPQRTWIQQTFPRLGALRLENIVLQRPIDTRVLAALSGGITHLQMINVHRGPLNDTEILVAYSNLGVIEIAQGTEIRLPRTMRNTAVVRHISAATHRSWSLCAALDFYVQDDGSVVDFEREVNVVSPSEQISDLTSVRIGLFRAWTRGHYSTEDCQCRGVAMGK
jgi:hypothetical protein